MGGQCGWDAFWGRDCRQPPHSKGFLAFSLLAPQNIPPRGARLDADFKGMQGTEGRRPMQGGIFEAPSPDLFFCPPPGCIRTPSPASLSPLPLPACWHLKVTAAYAWVDRVSACGCAHTQGPGKGGGRGSAGDVPGKISSRGCGWSGGGGRLPEPNRDLPHPHCRAIPAFNRGAGRGRGLCQAASGSPPPPPPPPAARWGFLRPLRPRSATEEGNGNV